MIKILFRKDDPKIDLQKLRGGLPPRGCGCCICSPETQGAGDVTAQISGILPY